MLTSKFFLFILCIFFGFILTTNYLNFYVIIRQLMSLMYTITAGKILFINPLWFTHYRTHFVIRVVLIQEIISGIYKNGLSLILSQKRFGREKTNMFCIPLSTASDHINAEFHLLWYLCTILIADGNPICYYFPLLSCEGTFDIPAFVTLNCLENIKTVLTLKFSLSTLA